MDSWRTDTSPAFTRLRGVYRALLHDSDFRKDLRHPLIAKLVDHWTNKHRLPIEEANALTDPDGPQGYLVKDVFNKLRSLQEASKAAGVEVPLPALIRGEDVFAIAEAQVLSESAAQAQSAAPLPGAASEAKAAHFAKDDAQPATKPGAAPRSPANPQPEPHAREHEVLRTLGTKQQQLPAWLKLSRSNVQRWWLAQALMWGAFAAYIVTFY